MSETCCTRLAENTGRKNNAKNRHLGIIATKACIDNRKKLFSTCPHNMVNFGLLTAEICWRVWHPCKFQRVSRLGSVTARHPVVGVSQTLRRWTEGATYVRQGDHYVGHWPTFLVLFCTHSIPKRSHEKAVPAICQTRIFLWFINFDGVFFSTPSAMRVLGRDSMSK